MNFNKIITYLYLREERFLTEINVIINQPAKLKIEERKKKKKL
jgi:hypothetical protein